MTDMREMLKSTIKTMIEGLKHLDLDAAADLIAEVADEMAEGGPDDLFNGAILDGIRWGYSAAVTVEIAGGAMVRVILPGGIGITHEWDSDEDAKPFVDAAMRAITSARATARNAGE